MLHWLYQRQIQRPIHFFTLIREHEVRLLPSPKSPISSVSLRKNGAGYPKSKLLQSKEVNHGLNGTSSTKTVDKILRHIFSKSKTVLSAKTYFSLFPFFYLNIKRYLNSTGCCVSFSLKTVTQFIWARVAQH